MMLARRSFIAGLGALSACGQTEGGEPELGPVSPSSPQPPPPRRRVGPAGWRDPQTCSARERIARPRRYLRSGLAPYGLDWVALSPDGRRLAARDHRTVHFSDLETGEVRSAPLGGPSFGAMSIDDSLVWDDGGQALWCLAGETTRSGFSAGPLRCARLQLDGRQELAPPLRDLPGRLDQVAWVGGRGVGVALFDLRGGHYQPEQENPNPGLAVIDAARGQVRAVLSGRDTILAPWGQRDAGLAVYIKALHQRADGRVQLLAQVSSFGQEERRFALMLWTEGEAPLFLDEEVLPEALRSAFAPDGRLLVSEDLQPGNRMFDVPNPPPLTPTTGAWASLWNPAAGRRLWRLQATVDQSVQYMRPIMRADGRQALVSLPEACGDNRPSGRVGLIEVASGRVLSRHVVSRANQTFVGFHRDRPWIVSDGEIAFY
jgi:hypothetical protein